MSASFQSLPRRAPATGSGFDNPRLQGVVVLGVTTALAQQAGQIVGVITDSSGAVVPGAVVKVVEVGTGFSQSAITGSAGEYVLPALRPTQYEQVAEMRGFRSFHRSGVELLTNQSLTLNVVLEVGAVTETVVVAGAAVQVNTTTSTLSEVVDRARIVELPLNGRRSEVGGARARHSDHLSERGER